MKKIKWEDFIEVLSQYELSDDVLERLGSIRSEFDERTELLTKYGIAIEGDSDEYTIKEIVEDDYKKKYDELKRKYTARFLGGGGVQLENAEGSGITKSLDDEVEKETEKYRIEDLFTGKEGD